MSADRIKRLVKDAFWHIDEWRANRQSGPETANSVKACLHEIDSLVRLLASHEKGEPDVTARALRSVVRRYKRKLDTAGDPAARYTYRNVVDDLEGILRAADLRAEIRPGPVQEASDER